LTPDVVIAGAGAGGLASARALGALGLEVLVLDRRGTPATVAKGEILQPEAVRILDRWGALDALRASGARPVGRLSIRDPVGRPLLSFDYGTLPGRYRQILCADYTDLQAALADGLPSGVEIRRGVRVVGVLRDARGRVSGVQVAGDGDGEIRAPLVIAADGMSSRLRNAVGVEVARHEYPHRLLAFDVAGARVADEVCAYRTSRGLCLVYPLPGGRCRLYVQVKPDEFRSGGMTGLAGWCDRLLADVPAIRRLETAFRASLNRRQLLAVYRLRAERLSVPGLALVGEAAHAVHPMAAQGVNSSLADAEAIADAIASAPGARDAAGIDRTLETYQAGRAPRLDHIATVSHNASRMITSVSGLPQLLGARMMRGTAANPRLLRITAGNLSGVSMEPLSLRDRFYQMGLLGDDQAHAAAAPDLSEAR
jgi:2-polyprenyl-6-methoxyphenol hydroxylase-like FAD-dependent oxidoreductase